ncbi:MAG: SufD family Fe-S cluster assembly protein [Oscillospiraceae bacterium]|nr:SufD family Fe-S cluster assembly protein [Oscillospiraceae bacterium]
MNQIDKNLLETVASLHEIPEGAYNIRKDGKSEARNSTAAIQITPKEGVDGIEIHIAPETREQSVHIPVILAKSGIQETVENDFYVGENSDVLIVAGCGIHNSGSDDSAHSGVHTFYIGKGAHVKYVEKHYGEGEGTGSRIMNPKTVVYLEEGASMEMDMTQIRGIDSTNRETTIHVGAGAEVVLTERLLTHGMQKAESRVDIFLDGADSTARILSRSVGQDQSEQIFFPCMTGNEKCFGHVQCDSIIMGDARISSIPAIRANCVDAQLIHEAAIGKIAGDQLLKLMTLGLTEEEAEEHILNGFLK